MSQVSQVAIPRPKRWDVPFSDEMTDDDVERIIQAEPFNEIDRSKFRSTITLEKILKNDARIVRCRPGDIIVRAGDWGNSAFFILSGTVRVQLTDVNEFLSAEGLGRPISKPKSWLRAVAQLWTNHKEPEFRALGRPVLSDRVGSRGSGDQTRIFLHDVPRILNEYRTARIDEGELFGELAALGRMPRQATVFAEGEAELLEIRWQGLRDIMRRDLAVKRHIETLFRERSLEKLLRTIDIFSHVTDDQMEQLIRHARFDTFGMYDSPKPFGELVREGNESGLKNEALVAREGNYPYGIILICSGLARVSRRHHYGHRTQGYLSPGQIYGFEEIAEAWETKRHVPFRMSLRAIGYLTTVVVPTPLVEEFVLEQDHGRRRSRQTSRRARRKPINRRLDDNHDLIEFTVDNSLIQGTATMIINLDRCTRCDDCVRACAATHDNNPRFLRHGPVQGHFMVANACMHCADPVCMIECPTGAIFRDIDGGQVVINDQTCIGCTSCAKNCPYDAIRMVEVRDRSGNLIRDEKNQLPIQQATKCDLCVEQRIGPACQNACPHDALYRVNMSDLDSFGDVINR